MGAPALLALLVLASAAAANNLDRAAFLPLTQSVVRVEARQASGGLGVGTAVTVAPGVAVTNCHVTRDAVAIRVIGHGRPWTVAEQAADAVHDLCFLRVPDWPGAPVRLADSDHLRTGQRVAALGFTGGVGATVQFGAITALHRYDGSNIIETDTAFTSGASGGGLFDEYGALIGLLTFRLRGVASNYYSVPLRWIRDRMPPSTAPSTWAAVQPLAGAQPFWQGDVDRLPYFMRVASLHAQQRWDEIIEIAERWAAFDPSSAEPDLARGNAYQQLARFSQAIESFDRAVKLAPRHALAWYGFGRSSASAGDANGLARAQAALNDLDEQLAQRLRADTARKKR